MAELTTAAGSAPPTPIVALDVRRLSDAMTLVDRLGESCRFYKVGLELFVAEGPRAVDAVRERGAEVFLDLKLHDIPNTVAGAVRQAAALGVRLLTVHASGGRDMLRAAAEAAGDACGVLAVTLLTSLDAGAAGSVFGREVADVGSEVLRLAALAAEAELHGVVCSGHEAASVRAFTRGRLATLVPGIRRAGGDAHDQARVVTPAAAAQAGARYVVLGRAVTGAPDAAEAMRAVLAELGHEESSPLRARANPI